MSLARFATVNEIGRPSRARRLLAAAALSVALIAPLSFGTTVAAGQDVPPEIATAPNSAQALINTDGVYVRSGAGDNYYPVAKLNKEAAVTVVGAKFDWLKIQPPQGTFSYVAKAFVEKSADGKTGTVNRDDVNVRAGGDLNSMKTTVQGKLAKGAAVQILGEVDEYYKIAPPADAFVYVNKQYVDLQRVIAKAPQPAAPETPAAPAAPVADAGSTAPQGPAIPEAPAATGSNGGAEGAVATAANTGAAATTPDAQPAAGAATPATQPAAPLTAEAEFDKVEAEFLAASEKTIEEQPVSELLATYQKLVANPQLPESMRRIADFRVQTLKVRATARDEFLAVQKQQQESKQKLEAARAEQEELKQHIEKNDVKVYTAVGTLRTSSLQVGGQVLYRLTDPSTGRTVCYLRSDDAKYGGQIGQFIGVRGDLSTDPSLSLKVVTPTEFAPVDPNQLYRGVAAQIVPPSLLPQAAVEASAAGTAAQ